MIINRRMIAFMTKMCRKRTQGAQFEKREICTVWLNMLLVKLKGIYIKEQVLLAKSLKDVKPVSFKNRLLCSLEILTVPFQASSRLSGFKSRDMLAIDEEMGFSVSGEAWKQQ